MRHCPGRGNPSPPWGTCCEHVAHHGASRPELWPLDILRSPVYTHLRTSIEGDRGSSPALNRRCSPGRGIFVVPSVARIPQAAHTMRQGPTASMLLSTDLGEMKIPEPMMVPTMMQMPLNRPSSGVEEGRGGLVLPPSGAQEPSSSLLPSLPLWVWPGQPPVSQAPSPCAAAGGAPGSCSWGFACKSINPHNSLMGRVRHYHTHFTEGKIEEQKDSVTAQGSHPVRFIGPAEVLCANPYHP